MELKKNNNYKIIKFLELPQDQNSVFRRKHVHLGVKKLTHGLDFFFSASPFVVLDCTKPLSSVESLKFQLYIPKKKLENY